MIRDFKNGTFDVNVGDLVRCSGDRIGGCSTDVTDRTDIVWKVVGLNSNGSHLNIVACPVHSSQYISGHLHDVYEAEEPGYYFNTKGLIYLGESTEITDAPAPCYYCGQIHPHAQLIDGRTICPDCMESHSFVCIECGEVHDTRRRMKGINLCRPCFDANCPSKYVRAYNDGIVYPTSQTVFISSVGYYYTSEYAESHLIKCGVCGKYEVSHRAIFKDNKFLCSSCADEHYPVCPSCGERHNVEDMHDTRDGKVCSRCLNIYYRKCEFCGEYVAAYSVEITKDTRKHVCRTCASDMRCTHCGYVYEFLKETPSVVVWHTNRVSDDSRTAKICSNCKDYYTVCADCGAIVEKIGCSAPDGKHYCGTHVKNHFLFCNRCTSWRPADFSFYGEDENRICSDCYIHEENGTRDGYDGASDGYTAPEGMQDYYYKPTPVFYPRKKGNGLFYGFELEVDDGEDSYDVIEHVNNLLGITYAKHDGSLGDEGIEFVSHPATIEYYMSHKDKLKSAMDYMKGMGYCSYSADTCGLHIHASAFPLLYNTDNGVEKLLWFQDKYWDNLFKFSRRTMERISDWANRITVIPDVHRETSMSKPEIIRNLKDAKKNAKNTGRYKSINLQNTHTIEFRLFAGTLNIDTFIATLQLVSNLCELAVEKSFDEFRELTWEDVIAYKEYPELKAYWESRFLDDDERFKYDRDYSLNAA